MWSKAFLVDLAERAVKTFAQALAAAFGVGVTVLDVDWAAALAVSATAALLSVLTSIASHPVGGADDASAVYVGRHREG